VEQRPLHWSERAKMYPRAHPPGSVGSPRPGGSQPSGRPPKKSFRGGGSRRGFWVTVAVILCVAVAAAVVFLWYLPNRGGSSADSDLQARNLVRQAKIAIENAFVDTQTFDPSVMTADVLSTIEPAITFNRMAGDSAATLPTAMAADSAVNYAGTATTYAVGTVSESGTTYGLIVDKQDDTVTYYTNGKPVPDWNIETESTPTTQGAQTPRGIGPVSPALDTAAQILIRNSMTTVESA
jgi:hypothetical protein